MKGEANIVICGDICPTQDTKQLFEAQDSQSLFNGALSLTQNSDLTMANLEFPLIDNGQAVKKTGPILSGKTSFINVFKDAGFNLLGMANNHIKDLGEEGVLSTLKTCEENGINTVGAGRNIQAAKKPFISEVNDIKVGVMAFAEQEFNTANGKSAGANFIDVYYDFDAIREVKNEVDYLIILYHGGIEYHRYPSPDLQKRCRKMIESGADLVTCQHSHCIGTAENYKSGDIIYGQGNTIFGLRKDESWNHGLIINLVLKREANKIFKQLDLKPITATSKGIELLEKSEADKVLQDLQAESRNLDDADFIAEKWNAFCNSKASLYLPLILGFNRVLIHLNRLTGNRLVKLIYSRQKLRTMLNVIRCESHYEVLRTILKKSQ